MQEDVMGEFHGENQPKQSSEVCKSTFSFFYCCCNDETEQTHGQNFHEQRSQGTTAEACPLIKPTPRNANPPQRLYAYNDYAETYFTHKFNRLY